LTVYDKAVLGRQAAELGFIRDTYEKVLRLADVLKSINADPLLGDALALKGGTAINLTVFELPRLSVDIDLDYTRNNDRDAMLAERAKIADVIARHMAASGYRPGRQRQHHSLDASVWAYTNSAGVRDNIKIEINYSLRAHAWPVERRPVLVIDTGTAATLAPVEVFASKVVALLTRGAARDLYDVANLVQHGLFSDPVQADRLRRTTVLYMAVGTDKVPDAHDFRRVAELTERRIRADLQPVLRKRDWFDLAAAKVRTTEFLRTLLALTPSEVEFLNAFQAGSWNPELLFDGDCLERVRIHPMAHWKTSR
jgi:predicted nucleotidyltransferase component of viral defense system